MVWPRQNVLVTGGAGFLGSEIVRQLSNSGAYVIVIDNLSSGREEYISGLQNVKMIKGDICDRDVVARALRSVDLIINLAALPFIPDSYHHPRDFFEVNVNGTLNLLMESVKLKTIRRFVHISSSEVYGTAKTVPMSEEHPTNPHSTYAVSKLAADRLVFTFCKEHDLPGTVVRPFNCYGPRVTQPYIIPEIAIQLLKGNYHIKLGNTESIRDFTYVSDTAEGIIAALMSDGLEGQTINLGAGKGIRIKDLVYMIADIIGMKVNIVEDKTRYRVFDVETLVCDNRKAKELLRWKPHISIGDGLKNTVEWIAKQQISFKSPFKGWSAEYRAEIIREI